MKLAYVVFARDKEPWVAECVNSILAQSYSPMEIVFSDQGSKDNTLAIIKETVNGYNGPNKIRILECPETEPRGMAGLLAHINWLHNMLEADFWITCSADDFDYPGRAQRTMETIHGLGTIPMYLGTAQHFLRPDLSVIGVTPNPQESKWVEPMESLKDKVGGSCSGAWSPLLLQEFGPLPMGSLTDVYMPFCAALRGGFYFIAELLHAYVERDDPNNTGLGGRNRMAKTEEDRRQIEELVQYEFCANLNQITSVTGEVIRQFPDRKDLDEVLQFLYSNELTQMRGWVEARGRLTKGRIAPALYPA